MSCILLLALGASVNAELFELKIKENSGKPNVVDKKQSVTEKERDPNSKRPLTLKQCSIGYHGALQHISANEIVALKSAYSAAKAIDKELPGKLIILPPKLVRTAEQKKAISKAKLSARYRGRSPWLETDNPGWAIRQMIADLQTYTKQPFHPFLCTGSSIYADFLAQYLPKAQTAAGEAKSLAISQRLYASERANDLWHDMRAPPMPTLAPTRPTPVFSLEKDFRPAVFEAEESSLQAKSFDQITTNSAQTGAKRIADADMPFLDEREKIIDLYSTEDAAITLSALVDRAYELGVLYPPSIVPVESLKQAGFDGKSEAKIHLFFFEELKNAASVLKFNLRQGNITDRVAREMGETLSALEIFYYVSAKEQQIDHLYYALNATVNSIDTQQSKNCKCRQ